MRKYVYSFLLFIVSVNINAQEKILTVGLGAGLSFAQGDFKELSKQGNCFYINVLYNLNDRFSAGVEGNFTRFSPDDDYGDDKTKIDGISLKGQYSFQFKNIRPYSAIMAGFYNNTFSFPTGYDGDTWTESIYSSSFGGGIMVGFNYKKLNVGIAYYNLGQLNDKIVKWDDVEYVKSNISFIQLKVGLDISFFTKKMD